MITKNQDKQSQLITNLYDNENPGGKANGLIRAYNILFKEYPNAFSNSVFIQSFYSISISAFSDFIISNNLSFNFLSKYDDQEILKKNYSIISKKILNSPLPKKLEEKLLDLLKKNENHPLIVRSSSLIEDSFNVSMAGKYDSVFCPNQGSIKENFLFLSNAIKKVYSSTFKPDAIQYRLRNRLIDYDEKMGILIQKVNGSKYKEFFFPAVSGVGLSKNIFRWSEYVNKNDGFLRLVSGLGTRAVNSYTNDYPKIVALSHPSLNPNISTETIAHNSQYYIDIINLKKNAKETVKKTDVFSLDYPDLEIISSYLGDDYIKPVSFVTHGFKPEKMIISFDSLINNTSFTETIKTLLKRLENGIGEPVSIEFTVGISYKGKEPRIRIFLLQCRPIKAFSEAKNFSVPKEIEKNDLIFSANKLIPYGEITNIKYIIYVDPQVYSSITELTVKYELPRIIGSLNKKLEKYNFILMGPGRWGSSNIDLGLKVNFSELYNTKVLIEIGLNPNDSLEESSIGTHFFMDLLETGIFTFPIFPSQKDNYINPFFFQNAQNCLNDILDIDSNYKKYIKVIDIPSNYEGKYLNIILDGQNDKALGFLRKP
ncbi:MAG: PEP/pyruvate-binding domain-containing protein [Ignavibacteria bacterium]|jgi:hypothetical protein